MWFFVIVLVKMDLKFVGWNIMGSMVDDFDLFGYLFLEIFDV